MVPQSIMMMTRTRRIDNTSMDSFLARVLGNSNFLGEAEDEYEDEEEDEDEDEEEDEDEDEDEDEV